MHLRQSTCGSVLPILVNLFILILLNSVIYISAGRNLRNGPKTNTTPVSLLDNCQEAIIQKIAERTLTYKGTQSEYDARVKALEIKVKHLESYLVINLFGE